MVTVRRIPNGKGGFVRVMEWDNFEYIQPTEYFKELSITSNIAFEEDILIMNKPPFPLNFFQNFLRKRAEIEWVKEYNKLKTLPVPNKLIELLNSTDKNEQLRALNGLDITADELTRFYLFAGEERKFTISRYREHHIPPGFEKAKFPVLYTLQDDGSVLKVGDTDLSDKQLKQIIEQRHVVIADILDNGENWHCFYKTYKSLAGRETYKGGQPHLHYISNFWTIPRETIVKEFQNRKQAFTSSVHIDYFTHRNPKKTSQ